MREVVIYDLSNPVQRKTIYADSGHISFAANHVDLNLDLYKGQMIEVTSDKPQQLDRMFYRTDRIVVKDVGRVFTKTSANDNSKGDREMGICEMQQRFWQAEQHFENTIREVNLKRQRQPNLTAAPPMIKVPEPHGLGWAYCKILKLIPAPAEAQAADVSSAHLHQPAQDSVKKLPPAQVPPGAQTPNAAQSTQPPLPQEQPGTFVPNRPPGQDSAQGAKTQERIAAEAAAALMRAANPPPVATPAVAPPSSGLMPLGSRGEELRIQLELAQRARNRYEIEIHKKFSLAAACLIFCIMAPPIALRFPRGGVGLVIGVSLAVFALYYVGLIGGEAMANKGLLPPIWAMWGTNLLMVGIGLVMMLRIGRDSGSGRGGGLREWLDTRRMLRDERRSGGRGS
jgi:lipopolysaccharide export system permease protein